MSKIVIALASSNALVSALRSYGINAVRFGSDMEHVSDVLLAIAPSSQGEVTKVEIELLYLVEEDILEICLDEDLLKIADVTITYLRNNTFSTARGKLFQRLAKTYTIPDDLVRIIVGQ